jgi:type I restriction enzyme S subunit
MTVGLAFPVVQLSTLASPRKGAIAGGPFGSDLVSKDYVECGVPVVRGRNLPLAARFSTDNFVFVSPNKADALHLNCAVPGDLVFTQRGTLGQVGILPANTPHSRFLISQSQMKMTVDASKASATYLYYYFRMSSTVSYIENIALQAGVPHINLGILRKFPVVAPPLNVQVGIAAALSAYDEAIEINRQRIALLERMAEQLYREWFVRFRFPGHKQAKFEKGVPAGWKLHGLGDLGTFLNGFPFKPSDWGTEGTPIIKIKEMTGGVSGDTPRNRGDAIPKKYSFADGDIIFSWSGTFVALIWDQGPGLLNQHLFKVSPAPGIPKSYLYLSIKTSIPWFQSLATGATMQHIKRKELDQVKVPLPPQDLLTRFDNLVSTMIAERIELSKANRVLTAMRDLLLPRLISGKLRVDDLDIQFPPSMQDAAA